MTDVEWANLLWGLVKKGRDGGLPDDVITNEMSLLLGMMLTGTARSIIKPGERWDTAKILAWMAEIVKETITVPADELLDLAMSHEAEFGQLGGYFGRLLEANRKRAQEWHHPMGYAEGLDPTRSAKPPIVIPS